MIDSLLDAHAVIWFFQADPRLGGTAKALIEDPANRELVSIATCWEIAIKVGLGKLNLGEPTRPCLERAIARNSFELSPISLAHAAAVEGLPPYHKDPFDRLLIAQAIVEGIPIIGADVAFDAYPVRRIWEAAGSHDPGATSSSGRPRRVRWCRRIRTRREDRLEWVGAGRVSCSQIAKTGATP